MDGWRYLRSDDPVERLAFVALAPKVAERRRNEMKALASEIVNVLAKSLK